MMTPMTKKYTFANLRNCSLIAWLVKNKQTNAKEKRSETRPIRSPFHNDRLSLFWILFVSTYHRQKSERSEFGSDHCIVAALIVGTCSNQHALCLVAFMVAVCGPHVIETILLSMNEPL